MRVRSRFSTPESRALVLLVLSLVLDVNLAAAQQGAAGIAGQVADENGGVLPGVTVTARSPALQVPSVTSVTDERGEYRLIPLPIGTYAVEYSLPGFQTVREEGLRLEIGLQAKLDKVLKVGSMSESIVVSGSSPVVDVAATSTSTKFTRETLELTPTSRNGIISLGAQAPGVKGRVDIGGGTVGDPPEFKAFGQKWGEYIATEGVETSHPGAGATAGNYYNYDAIEEAQVQSLSNGPEIPSYGVAITMILKSGGNDFHGAAAVAYAGKRTQSDNVDDELRSKGVTAGNPLVDRTDRGGDYGGRILRDKLWFYGAGRTRAQHRIQLGGFKPDGTPVQGYVGEITSNLKLSYQMNHANRFVFANQWSKKETAADNVTQFVAWESQGDRTRYGLRSQTYKGEWQSTRGSSLVTSLLFGRWAWSQGSGTEYARKNEDLAAQGIPHGWEGLLLSDEDHGGGRPSARDLGTQKVWGSAAGGNIQDTGKHYVKGTANWYKPGLFAGNHEFKTGFDYSPLWSINGTPSRGKAGDYQLVFTNGNATQIDLFNGPVTPESDVSYLGVFANDRWVIARRLTLDLGARYSRDNPVIPAQCRVAGSWPFAPAACTEKIQFNKFSSIAPRLYFSYDVMGDAKTVVKGGWGRFDQQRIYDLLGHANPIRSFTSTYRWRDLNGNKDYDPGEVNLDPNGPDFLTSNVPASGEPNPNEKRPGTDQFSVTVERQLASDFAVRLIGVYIRTFNESRFLNLRRGPEAYNIPITNPDPGRDNAIGTADDPGTFITYYDYPANLAGRANEYFIISNDPTADETHKAFDAQVVKRISRGWQLLAGYSVTKNDSKLPDSANFTRTIPQWNPNVDINSGNHTWEHLAKLSGNITLPYAVSMSANYLYQSGQPMARQVLFGGGKQIPTIVLNAEPVGSIHLPDTTVLDVRFQKTFTTHGVRVTPRVNAYNLLNSNSITAWNVRSGGTYLLPTAILPARIVEFGLGVTF
jgi:hypothetical protein